MGAFLGWKAIFYIIFISSVLGTLIGGTILLVCKKEDQSSEDSETSPDEEAQKLQHNSDHPQKSEDDQIFDDGWRPEKHHIPFGPYLTVAGYVSMIYYDQIETMVKFLFKL